MNTHSHTLIGNLLHDYFSEEYDIHLNKDEFIKGNVAPDYRTACVIHPHFMRYSLGYIQREIDALARKSLRSADIGKEYSFKLGMICHYYADFFCYAHGNSYKQAIVNHLRYEHGLRDYFTSRIDVIREIDFLIYSDIKHSSREINERTKKLIKEYEAASPSYGKDIYYTLMACAEAVVSLIECSLANVVPINRVNLPLPLVLPQASGASGGIAI